MPLSNDYYLMFTHEERQEPSFPKQNDSFNCGIYSMWYTILSIFKNNTFQKFDPLQFRRKLILFVVVLHVLDDASIKEEMSIEIQNWLCSQQLNHVVSDVFKQIKKDDDSVTTSNLDVTITEETKFMRCPSVVRFMEKFRKLIKGTQKIFFAKSNLRR